MPASEEGLCSQFTHSLVTIRTEAWAAGSPINCISMQSMRFNIQISLLILYNLFLSRSFQRPFIAPARLQENIDRLLLAITMKLKSKSRAPTVLSFHHDCYRFLFFGKGRPSKDGKSTMLEKDDFARCNFHDLWEQCLDKLGDGVRIKFPVKIHITLGWSPKCSAVQGGILVNPPRIPLEKLTIDFVRQPFSILNAWLLISSSVNLVTEQSWSGVFILMKWWHTK